MGLRITFHSSGAAAGIGQEGDYPFLFNSLALFRFRLVDGEVVDLYENLGDEAALEKSYADARAAEAAEAAKDAAAEAGKPYELFKTEVISRMTDDELEVFEMAMEAATVRQRRMWLDCTRLVSSEPMIQVLWAQFAQAFGQARADAILARP